MINPAYEHEVKLLLKGRERWKVTRDTFEAGSKIVSSFATILAFAASSLKDPIATDWTSFASGCFGTMSLVMLLFAGYSGKSSRARTRELNDLLLHANITPMPQIAKDTGADDGDDLESGGDGGGGGSSTSRLNMDTVRHMSSRESRDPRIKESHRHRTAADSVPS